MRSHVEFRSSKFPAYPGEDDEVNPYRWGKRLAEYLHQQLLEHGIETDEIFCEDWGWVVPIRHAAFPMWVGCGNYEEAKDAYLVFIEPSKPMIRRWIFKRINTTVDVARIADAIDTILKSDPEIREVRWWAENER